MTERADMTMRLPILQLSFRLFWQSLASPRSVSPLQPIFGSLLRLAFPKAKIAVAWEEICEYHGHTVHKLSQRRLTAYWLAPWESDCSRMHSKVSSDWLPSYIKATRTVLEIFKMAGYFPDSPLTVGIRVYCLLGRAAICWNCSCPLVLKGLRAVGATAHVLSSIIRGVILNQT